MGTYTWIYNNAVNVGDERQDFSLDIDSDEYLSDHDEDQSETSGEEGTISYSTCMIMVNCT